MSDDLSLNLTEVLTALQDFMTQDGAIPPNNERFTRHSVNTSTVMMATF